MRTPRFFLLAALLASFLSVAAAPSDPARHAWMKGYEAMLQAEQEEKSHSDLAALRHFEQALEIFRQVNHDYPEWNTSILKYRIDYCQNKIAAIKEQKQQDTSFYSREELVAQLAATATDLQACREQAASLESQLRESREALQRARAEAAAQTTNEENLRILRNDREVLTAQVQKLTAQLAAAQELLKQNEGSLQNQAENAELHRQLDAVTAQLEQKNRQLEQTTAAREALEQQCRREAQWHSAATEQLDALRAQLAAANQRADLATAQLEECRQSLRRQGASSELPAAADEESASPTQLRAKLRARESELQNAQMELLNVRRQLAQLQESADANYQELTELRRRTTAENQLFAEKLTTFDKLKSENDRLSAQLTELQNTSESQRELLARLESNAAQSESQVKLLQAQLNAALGAAEGISANSEDTATLLVRNQVEIATLRQQAENDRLALEQAQKTIHAQQDSIDELLKGNSDPAIRATGQVWMEQLQETRAQLENAMRRQHELETALIKRENEKNLLAQTLRGNGEEDEPQANGLGAAAIQTPAGNSASLLSRQDAIILRAYLRQGVDAERAGKPESAQWNYEQALAIQPENPTALKRLGILAYQRHDFPECAQYLAEAFRLSQDDQDILLALGFTMLQLNQPQWALAYLARANALKPQDFQTAKLFGNALATLQWREAAIRQLKRALELQPEDAETAMTLALLQLTIASETALAAKRDPVHQEALERLAASQRKQALDWYQLAVQHGAEEDPQLKNSIQHP